MVHDLFVDMILSNIIAFEDVDKLQAVVAPSKSAASPSAPEVGVEKICIFYYVETYIAFLHST